MSNDRVNPPLPPKPARAPSKTPTVRERPRPHLWVRGRPRPHSAPAQAPSNPPSTPGRYLAALLPFLLAACTPLKVDPFPEPLRPPQEPPEAAAIPDTADPRSELRTGNTPGVVLQESLAEGAADRLGDGLTGPPIEVSFHDLPLVTFINEVFGERLGMSFVIAPGIEQAADSITLRLTEPLSPRRLFHLARNVLSEYGITLREEDGVLTFAPSEEIGTGGVPLITSGGYALPNIPDSHRTIFHFVPLKVTDGNVVGEVLEDAFQGQDLDVTMDRDRGGILLKGRRPLIAQAMAIIEVLDQPLLRSRHAAILDPAFLEAKVLAPELDRVLTAEGYGIGVNSSDGTSLLLVIEHLNKVIVFAPDRETLEHIEAWAQVLDDRRQESIEEAWFTYEVRNTQADAVASTLNLILGGSSQSRRPGATGAGSASTQGGNAAAANRDTGVSSLAGGLVVDLNRNMILFRGSGQQWAEILSVIEVLDKPIPSVLIEVIIAEVTLSDLEGSGFDFLLKAALDRYGVTGGTRGALGIKTSGLYATFDSGGQTRAVMGLFYEDSRVVIRSRPRVVVKSGQTASIEVGNEIPLITQAIDSGVETGGSTNVLQQVSYRKTGVQMDITPIVQASGRVDLEISQGLSEARPTASTSLAGSPTILNRSITTSLTLRDGGALLMGGLISGTRSGGNTGVPGVAQVPVLGRLFRSDSYQEDRTELMIMVIPYVIADYEEGWELTERMKEQMGIHAELME